MRRLRFALFAVCVICSAACKQEIKFEKGNIPKDIAYQLALKEIDYSLTEVDIWVSKEKVKANTIVRSLQEPCMTSPGLDSWFFLVDEFPHANWTHPCQYFFVDMDGHVFKYSASFPPDNIEKELLNVSDFTKKALTVSPVTAGIGTKSENIKG